MAFRNVSVLFQATGVGAFTSQVTAAGRSVQKFSTDVNRAGGGVARSSTLITNAMKGLGLAAGVAFVAAAVSAARFEEQMRNVNSISRLSEDRIASLGDRVVELSTKTPQSAVTLAEGLYQIASSGFQGADGLRILEAAARSASAGMTDTETSAKGIVAVLNAYGLSAADAADVSDILFETVNLGVLTFEELANEVGTFVGLAAMAGVSFDQMGAALATMTLAGINAAESSTALNRVMQAFIDPSDAMMLQLRNLGFENGIAALETRGLHGIMMDLGRATGGNVMELQRLFPEIRAMKGAMALLVNEGQTYTRVAAKIEDEQTRAGAATKAFEEQAKGLLFQLRILRNEGMAKLIEGGMMLLPMFQRVVTGARDFGRFIGEVGRQVLDRAGPGIEALGESIENIGSILQTGARAAVPFVSALAQIGGGAVIGAFNALAAALRGVTGFLERHRIVVQFGAAMLAAATAVTIFSRAWAAVQLITVGGGFIAGMTSQFAAFRTTMTTTQATMAMTGGAARALGSSMIAFIASPAGVATLALAALALGMQRAAQRTADIKANAEQMVAAWAQDQDLNSVRGRETAMERLGDKIESTRERIQRLKDTSRLDEGEGFGGLVGMVPALDSVADAVHRVTAGQSNASKQAQIDLDAWQDKLDDLTARQRRFGEGVDDVRLNLVAAGADVTDTWEITDRQFELVGDRIGVDLAAKGEKGREAVEDVTKRILEMADAAGFSGDQIDQALRIPTEVLEEMAEVGDAVAKSFSDAGDVVGAFGGETEIARGDVEDFYASAVSSTEDFLSNIQEAYRLGLDPQLIVRMMQAGPEQAGPLLDAIVSGADQAFIDLINTAESRLSELQEIGVQFARITQIAMRAPTVEIAAQADEAMRLVQEQYRLGRQLTIDEAKDLIGVDEATARQIGESYGVSFTSGVEAALAQASPLEGPEIEVRRDLARTALGDVGLGAGVRRRQIIDVIFDPGSTADDVMRLANELNLTDIQMRVAINMKQVEEARTNLDGFLDRIGLIPEEKTMVVEALGAENAVGEIQRLGEQLNMTPEQVSTLLTVVGTPEALAAAEQVAEKAGLLDELQPAIDLLVNSTDANAEMEGFQRALTTVDGKTVFVTLDADTAAATSDTEAWRLYAEQVEATGEFGADPNPADTEVAGWVTRAGGAWGQGRFNADAGPADASTSAWVGRAGGAQGWGQLRAATGGADADVSAWISATEVRQARIRMVPIFAEGGIMFGAGGVYGRPVKHYQGGGTESHVAQVASFGTPVRVWNEPETGGEVYMPLALSKRGTTLPILEWAAHRFGFELVPMDTTRSFANGGTTTAVQSAAVTRQAAPPVYVRLGDMRVEGSVMGVDDAEAMFGAYQERTLEQLNVMVDQLRGGRG